MRTAKATVGALAEEADYSRVTLDLYVNGRRPASRALALALADSLEARAERIRTAATRLRDVANERGS